MGRSLALACSVLFAGCATPEGAFATAKTRHVIYGSYQDFKWTEEIAGEQLLEESGSLPGIGYLADGHNTRYRVELLMGDVEYDGQTQDGTPAKSETSYTMLLFEYDDKFAGVKDSPPVMSVDDYGVEQPLHAPSGLQPYLGMGVRLWDRDIKSTAQANGAAEQWLSLSFHIGVDYSHWYAKDSRVFVNVRGGLSLVTLERAEVAGDSVFLNPKPGPMFKLELGWEMDHLHISAFGDFANYGESDPETSGDFTVLQPESEMTRLGLNVGYRW